MRIKTTKVSFCNNVLVTETLTQRFPEMTAIFKKSLNTGIALHRTII